MIGEKAGFIDKTGKYVINPQFLGMPEFKNGVAIVYTEGKDKDGNAVAYDTALDRAGKVIWKALKPSPMGD